MEAIPITAPITDRDISRFWAKVHFDPSGCLIWTAAKHKNGYGAFGHGGRVVKAHRFAYEALAGPVPDGLELDHTCRNRACVSPLHLEPVTASVNVRRGVAARRTQGGAA